MSSPSESITSPNSSIDPAEFEALYAEVKEVEKKDANLTPKQQIDRLLRPGSTYFNLNPFEVLQIDPDTSLEDIKKCYKKCSADGLSPNALQLSILVHPDKNREDEERAKRAFDAVNQAYKTLEDEEKRKRAFNVVEEAKARTDQMLEEKRKKLKREGKPPRIDEDDPIKYKHAVATLTMKLFADKERRRRQLEARDMDERKRQREQEIEEAEKNKIEKEWQKNFEDSRQDRVRSWQNFKDNKTTTKKKKKREAPGPVGGIRPPKLKLEKRQ
ncbi:unnamed protein product [Notodromas monacha]|uniref:J domain-containing protein n=1 Tax=Notodromas monacha TaxID=399045 RepID=A0A7R9GC97_9CRUS|nr:unnamed protein product [Notodromas monacha]CAG0915596.1 unnamed protein product [Notodromas monacha]